MQAYQRKRHRILWAIIGPTALILLIVALINRPHWPRMDRFPSSEDATLLKN